MQPDDHDLAPTRWTDPRFAAAYATRIDLLDRELAWPAATRLITPDQPRRGLGRPDARLLELGSGTGRYARHLAQRHWTATDAIDISPALHRHGQRHLHDAWIHRAFPHPDGRLPLRRCQCTAGLAHLLLCHLPRPTQIHAMLTETHRVLRPDSPLVIIQPGDFGTDFQLLRYGYPKITAEPEPGEAYPIDYTLPDGSRLRTTAWHHPAQLLADLLDRTGFHLEEIRPLHFDGRTQAVFTMWTAHVRPD